MQMETRPLIPQPPQPEQQRPEGSATAVDGRAEEVSHEADHINADRRRKAEENERDNWETIRQVEDRLARELSPSDATTTGDNDSDGGGGADVVVVDGGGIGASCGVGGGPSQQHQRQEPQQEQQEQPKQQQQRRHNHSYRRDDVLVPVCQTVVVKRMVPDSYDDSSKVFMEATVVQRVLGYGNIDVEGGPLREFKYRVNGTLITGDACMERRRWVPLEPTTAGGGGVRGGCGADTDGMTTANAKKELMGICFTIDARVPLHLEDEVNLFPFRIVRASLSLEMASPSLPSGTVLRPDLWCIDEEAGGHPTELLHLKRRSDDNKNSSKRGGGRRQRGKSGGGGEDDRAALLDALPQWDFVNENPIRECPPEHKKDGTYYHPRMDLVWYMTDAGLKRMLPCLAPLYLVLGLAVINWIIYLNDEDDDGVVIVNRNYRAGHLNVSAGISLTAVVSLPNILNTLDMKSAFNINDAVFLFWFLGLALSSVPERTTAFCGLVFLAIAGLSPFLFLPYYLWKIRDLRRVSTVDYRRTVKGREKPRGGYLTLHHWKVPPKK